MRVGALKLASRGDGFDGRVPVIVPASEHREWHLGMGAHASGDERVRIER